MKCTKCKSEIFKIEVENDCSGCVHNGAWSEDDGYIYDDKIIEEKKLERTEAQEDGQCELDSCHNNGCYMFICAECEHKSIIPLIEE